MDAKDIRGLFFATIAYIFAAGAANLVIYFIAKLLVKTEAGIPTLRMVLLIIFGLGFFVWIYLVRELQRAF